MENEGKFIRLNNINIHYLEEGKNKNTVILIHGLGGSLRTWQRNIRPLARHFRVFALDLPGHGYSDKDKNALALPAAIKIINEFTQALRLEKFSLIGNSMGGLISLAYALQYPQKVSKLVLVGSAGLGRKVSIALRVLTIPILGEILAHPYRFFFRKSLNLVLFDKKLISRQLAEEMHKIRQIPGAKESMLSIARWGLNLFGQKNRIILLDRLSEIKMPVMIIWGKEDKVLPRKHGYKAFQKIGGSVTLCLFDNCGHWPHYEKAEEFNKLVIEFLKE